MGQFVVFFFLSCCVCVRYYFLLSDHPTAVYYMSKLCMYVVIHSPSLHILGPRCLHVVTQPCLLSNSERVDGGGEAARSPEGVGQSLERGSQAPSDGAEGGAADSEVSGEGLKGALDAVTADM